jgi:hypothetical protein
MKRSEEATRTSNKNDLDSGNILDSMVKFNSWLALIGLRIVLLSRSGSVAGLLLLLLLLLGLLLLLFGFGVKLDFITWR